MLQAARETITTKAVLDVNTVVEIFGVVNVYRTKAEFDVDAFIAAGADFVAEFVVFIEDSAVH